MRHDLIDLYGKSLHKLHTFTEVKEWKYPPTRFLASQMPTKHGPAGRKDEKQMIPIRLKNSGKNGVFMVVITIFIETMIKPPPPPQREVSPFAVNREE